MHLVLKRSLNNHSHHSTLVVVSDKVSIGEGKRKEALVARFCRGMKGRGGLGLPGFERKEREKRVRVARCGKEVEGEEG